MSERIFMFGHELKPDGAHAHLGSAPGGVTLRALELLGPPRYWLVWAHTGTSELCCRTGATLEAAIEAAEANALERANALACLLDSLADRRERTADLPPGYEVLSEYALYQAADGGSSIRLLWGVYQDGSRLSYQLTREDAVRVAREFVRKETP